VVRRPADRRAPGYLAPAQSTPHRLDGHSFGACCATDGFAGQRALDGALDSGGFSSCHGVLLEHDALL
jgi:hypothetical protein